MSRGRAQAPCNRNQEWLCTLTKREGLVRLVTTSAPQVVLHGRQRKIALVRKLSEMAVHNDDQFTKLV